MNKHTKKLCNNLLFCFLLFVLIYIFVRVFIKYYSYGLFGKLIEGNDYYPLELSNAANPKRFKERKPNESAKQSINDVLDTGGKYLDLKTIITTFLDYLMQFSGQKDERDVSKLAILVDNNILSTKEAKENIQKKFQEKSNNLTEYQQDVLMKKTDVIYEHGNSDDFLGRSTAFQTKMMKRQDVILPKLKEKEKEELMELFRFLENSGIVDKMISDFIDFLLEKDDKTVDDSDKKLKDGMNYFVEKLDLVMNDLYNHEFINMVKKRDQIKNK